MVVSNTTPLVYLAALGDFDLLRTLFEHIAIPQAVFRESTVGGKGLPVDQCVRGALSSWISVKDVVNSAEVQLLLSGGLHPGESEAIVLASELGAPALLMDDSAGVKAAAGVNVIRTPGIYHLAKKAGLVKAVRPKLDALRNAGFWLRDDHYRMILKSVGE